MLGENKPAEDNKKLTSKILEAKTSLLEKNLNLLLLVNFFRCLELQIEYI